MEEILRYKLGTIQRFQQSVGTRYTPAAVVRMPYSRRPSEQSCLFGLPQLSGKAMKAKSSSRWQVGRLQSTMQPWQSQPAWPSIQSSLKGRARRPACAALRRHRRQDTQRTFVHPWPQYDEPDLIKLKVQTKDTHSIKDHTITVEDLFRLTPY